MKKEDIIGKTDDELCCGMGGWFFKVVGESCLYDMAIVEYAPEGGNAKIKYMHWRMFSKKT